MPIINDRFIAGTSFRNAVSINGTTITGGFKSYNTYQEMMMDGAHASFAVVKDASGDPTVNSGFALYMYKNGGWFKLFEQEAMDKELGVHVQTDWDLLQNGPQSSAQDIDKAVKTANKFEYDEEHDDLTFNGVKVITENEALSKYLQLVRCVETEEPVRLVVEFFTSPAMDVESRIATMNSAISTDADKMLYFNGDNFTAVPTAGIPDIACGRFVVIDMEHVLEGESRKPLFIKWRWKKVSDDSTVLTGGCVYPSITPTSNESVGLVWRQVNN